MGIVEATVVVLLTGLISGLIGVLALRALVRARCRRNKDV